MSALPELPQYIYGREVGATERVLTLKAATDYGDARAAHARKQALEECTAELRGMTANNKTAQSAINQCAEALEELK